MPAVDESYFLSNLTGDIEIIAETNDGKVLGVSAMNGNFIWLAGGVHIRGVEASHYAYCISRWVNGQTVSAEAPAYAAPYIKAVPGKILDLFADKCNRVCCSDGDYLTKLAYDQESGDMRIYLVNVENTLAEPPAKISHGDIFAGFSENAEAGKKELILNCLLENVAGIESVKASSPEFDGEKQLPFTFENNHLKVVVEPGTFAGYLEIDAVLKK